MDDMDAISVKNLSFSYSDKPVLHDINLKIGRGSFTALLGPNGCGKTTLIKNISGYLKPQSGDVMVLDKPIRKLDIKERAKLVGYIPQNTSSEFNFTSYDIVMMGRFPYLKPLQREGNADREIVRESMRLTDTWHLKDRLLSELSGGERQRVLIARALAQKPSILLMDEPVSHLDIKYQLEIISLIDNLCSTLDITAVAVLHDINLAAMYCNEVILMRDGMVVSTGRPSSVLTEANIEKVFNVEVDVITPYHIVVPATAQKKRCIV
jgi:iron complex transport system ATP-binding protein